MLCMFVLFLCIVITTTYMFKLLAILFIFIRLGEARAEPSFRPEADARLPRSVDGRLDAAPCHRAGCDHVRMYILFNFIILLFYFILFYVYQRQINARLFTSI